ncbi:tRNA (guanosine(46)-N7)-methyltransferase TrmB [Oceanospirillum beijerinckii]|uniref:tRNA (guanosine(46)-N7)-methyltransferase TrmB n=1 Tax=Oceanospirillum beijerinckii TaxID=64976 RepID=UPI0003FCB33E|nr:tRNA (guanosine(46)-N7)-methyltransferase TrmB [Oceanospirillum beijerinckii]
MSDSTDAQNLNQDAVEATETENSLPEQEQNVPEEHKRRIRSFVLRTGRMTAGQQRGMDEFWPKWGLTLDQGMINPVEVFEREAPLVLEIGFGMGDSLLEQAKTMSDHNFIGIEVHTPGVGRLMAEAGDAGLTNLRAYEDDAIEILKQCIPDGSLDLLQLFFPDPWHKKRHHKRRIVQAEFAQLVRQKLKVGGRFHMATDWENYAEHMVEVMKQADGYENTATDGDYVPRPDSRPVTKFEKRGERLGHGVWDIIYRRTH